MDKIKLSIKNKASTRPFQGWGTSLCWWAHIVGGWQDEAVIEELCRKFFSVEDGLGLNIARYNFGATLEGQAPEEFRVGAAIPSYGTAPGQWDMTKDHGQRKVLEKALDNGVTIVEGFFNSPPVWMLKNPTPAGGKHSEGNLREDKEGDFVAYICDLMNKMAETWGIKFHCISPFNEPSSIWWHEGNNQEGCHYSVASQERIIKALSKAMTTGETYRANISGSEGWSTQESITMYNDMDEEARGVLDQINTHTYVSDDKSRRLIRALADRDDKPLWMSEVCRAAEGKKDYDDPETGLMIAKDIIGDLSKMKPEAWVYWQVLEDDDLEHNYGFIRASFTGGSETYTITKSYHYFMQFTKFIRPGMGLVTVPDEEAIAAFDEKNNTLVTVLLNDKDTSRGVELTVDGPIKGIKAYETNEKLSMATIAPAYEGNTVTLNLAPKSVMTVITEL